MASNSSASNDTSAALTLLSAAADAGHLRASAVENIRQWLTDPLYRSEAPLVAGHLRDRQWTVLNDVFWTVVPFGTAGRRGRMYPIGSNAINEPLIAQSAQGLANYVRAAFPAESHPRCVIGFDTRHRSRRFAELCCEVLTAAGFEVFLLGEPRSTPLLSFAVRQLHCHAGIMVSASHNPPSDNAIKVFWSTGGQLRPPHDQNVMRAVAAVRSVERVPFAQALAAGRVTCCQNELDVRYHQAVLSYALPGPRDLAILYSPLHGVGLTSIVPVLQGDGFADVRVFEPHAAPDGDFPNVPDNIANPERPEVFDAPIAHARATGCELVLASDPDADRIGCAAPLASGGAWQTLTGNQIGALLADFVLRRRRQAGQLHAESYIVKTLVTSEMLRRVADLHGVRTCGDVLTGFKWIAAVIDAVGARHFEFGCEEAHGYLLGDYVRDKDGAAAAMLLAELAAEAKHEGRTLHQQLDWLYRQVGYHAERTVTRTYPGAEGTDQLRAAMARLRSSPPKALAGIPVARVRDYAGAGAPPLFPFSDPPARQELDLVCFDLAQAGNYAAVRPSGTEPKLKFYLFAYRPPEACDDLLAVRRLVAEQLAGMQSDLLAAADGE